MNNNVQKGKTPKQGQGKKKKKNMNNNAASETKKQLVRVEKAQTKRALGGPRGSITSPIRYDRMQMIRSKMVRDYVGAMIDPKNNMSRIPDSYPRKTSVFRSIVSYDYPFETIAGSQRFSLAVQPVIGSITSPLLFQMGIVNNLAVGSDWSSPGIDWSSAGSYCSDLGGCDPRVDINSPYLVSNPDVFYQASVVFTGAALDSRSIYANPSDANATLVVSPLSYRLNIRQGVGAAYQTMSIPKGVWQVVLTARYTPSVTTANGVVLNPSYAGNVTNVTILNQLTSVTQSTVGTPTTVVVDMIVSSTGVAGGNNLSAALCDATTSAVIANPTLLTVTTQVNNTTVSGQPFVTSNGVIEQVRPVGCSVWASCNAPALVNGGTISAAYVPKDYLTSNYYANNDTTLGQGQFYESLAKVEGAYTGPFSNGAYVWWSPEDTGSLTFSDVQTANAQDWPALVISGDFAPLTAISGSSTGVLRIEACFVFEYITKSTAFEQEVCLGQQAFIDEAQQFIGLHAPFHAMANGKHKSFLNSVMKMASGAGKFLAANPGLVSAGLALL